MKIKLVKWWNNTAPNTVVGVSLARGELLVKEGLAIEISENPAPDFEITQPDPDAKTSEPEPEEKPEPVVRIAGVDEIEHDERPERPGPGSAMPEDMEPEGE